EAYEPNEFMFKVVQDLKLFFNDKLNCKCRARNAICFEKIGFENFLERLSQLRGLDDNERDLCVKSQLMIFQFSKSENNKLDSYKYQYNSSIPICRPVFLKLCDIGKFRLLALQKHLNTDGLIERIHGNTNRVPQNKSRVTVDFGIAQLFKDFLLQYTNLHGLPSPMKIRDDLETIIYLPTYMKYTTVYEEFKMHFNLEHDSDKPISYTTFYKLWQLLTPYIKFQPSASDLCDTCEAFKADIKFANDDDEKENLKFEYKKHQIDAERERSHYNEIIEKSKNDSTITHICYDWAQSVAAPFSPQQVGSIFFKSPFVIHIFGICKTDDDENNQLNYTIGEDELPEGTSKKGANTTLNMVYDSLQKIDRAGKKDLYVTCDNCPGQNKNNLSLWFWSWLVMMEWYENIYINFMIPGHTKFICDAKFGSIKKLYKTSLINTVDDVEEVINNSSEYNKSIRYKNGLGWKWQDFDSMLKDYFRTLPNIKKYHHFRFSSSQNDIGIVYFSKKSGGEEYSYNLLKNTGFDKNSQRNILEVAPLTDERKKYLYNKIRQHVDAPYRDTLCPNPN
ncbi:MAG: hypothetical protein QOK71_07840, partial [Nitrososphaeraceae archaeon]|nr:hypothetical protein [Nitrososphaeraceae archaeon]